MATDMDGVMILWDWAQRHQIGQLTGGVGSVNAVAATELDDHAVTGGDDATVRVPDLRSRQFVDQPVHRQ
ncbi:hypothetical protein N8J89_18455 [Crossiella sp. CA-258035]|uniref:hypothetical protein n=1 Tax=Crossiella sp. CA-258035 TaxID=2981138 RepID=UPI0024BC6CAE|nr:hypothetical protein [Crossiella sp. CA-258035]WHT22974.1 hypothetical protein N8J89_18455 [Crossiella sp. CA-258035]